jgi:hypothetical protein
MIAAPKWQSAAAALMAGGLVLALALPGCGPAATSRPPVTAPGSDASAPDSSQQTTLVQINCKPADARVLVNGKSRGNARRIAATGGLHLHPGLHRFEIKRRGYRTYRIELIVGDRAEVLEIKLQRKGRGSP